MNIADILIVYLTLGSPFAVYKYLQRGNEPWTKKLLRSLATLTFWIPDALRLGRRHLTNAYSTYDFVSSDELDAEGRRLTEILADLEAVLAHGPSSRREVRDALERYSTFAAASRGTFEQFGTKCAELVGVSGSKLTPHGVASMVRHNRRKLRHHHIQARREVIRLVEQVSGDNASKGRVFEMAIELASLLYDEDALIWLNSITEKTRIPTWKPESPKLDEMSPAAQLATSLASND